MAYAYNDSVAALSDILSDMPGVSNVTSESAVIEGVDSMMRKSTILAICISNCDMRIIFEN